MDIRNQISKSVKFAHKSFIFKLLLQWNVLKANAVYLPIPYFKKGFILLLWVEFLFYSLLYRPEFHYLKLSACVSKVMSLKLTS